MEASFFGSEVLNKPISEDCDLKRRRVRAGRVELEELQRRTLEQRSYLILPARIGREIGARDWRIQRFLQPRTSRATKSPA